MTAWSEVPQVADWPYDAPQDSPLTALRIPVCSTRPDRTYLVTFDRESAEQPTDREAAILASYVEFERVMGFDPPEQAEMLKQPFDVKHRYNTTTFHKRAEDSWAYHRRHWGGGCWEPEQDSDEQCTLVEAIDRIPMPGSIRDEMWQHWKAKRPEVFGEGAGRTFDPEGPLWSAWPKLHDRTTCHWEPSWATTERKVSV